MSKEILEMMGYRPPEARSCASCRFLKEYTEGDGPDAKLVHGCEFPNVGMVRLPGDGGVCQNHKTHPVSRKKPEPVAKKKTPSRSLREPEPTPPEDSTPEPGNDEGTPPPTELND